MNQGETEKQLVGRLVGLQLPLWMILLEERTDPRHASWVLLGTVSGLAVLAAAGQHQSPGPLCKPDLPTAHCAQPCGSSLQGLGSQGPVTEEQSQGETVGSVFKSKDSFLLQDWEKQSPLH